MKPRAYGSPAIRPETTVRQVVADFPAAREVFRKYGERDDPSARFGHLEPLTHFARRRGVPLETLLSESSEVTVAPVDRRSRSAKPSSLAVLVAEHPWIEDRLRPTGTRYLERARSLPNEFTIGSFAAREGFDAREIVTTINGWLAERPQTRPPESSATHRSQQQELERLRR